MRTVTTKTDVYKFDELSEKAQNNAVELLYDINVDYEWWEQVYEDATNIGLKITAFDIDRGSYVEAHFMVSAEETAHKIEKEHGESCETHKTAVSYLADRDKLVESAKSDENGDIEDEYALDNELDDLDAEFLKSLSEDYRIMLSKEYDYFTSREAIVETIQANDYDFTVDGKLFNSNN